MTGVELQEAFDAIREAMTACETYSVDLDLEAKCLRGLMECQLLSAQGHAKRILAKVDDWWEAEKARLYPHPTAREKAAHNEL